MASQRIAFGLLASLAAYAPPDEAPSVFNKLVLNIFPVPSKPQIEDGDLESGDDTTSSDITNQQYKTTISLGEIPTVAEAVPTATTTVEGGESTTARSLRTDEHLSSDHITSPLTTPAITVLSEMLPSSAPATPTPSFAISSGSTATSFLRVSERASSGYIASPSTMPRASVLDCSLHLALTVILFSMLFRLVYGTVRTYYHCKDVAEKERLKATMAEVEVQDLRALVEKLEKHRGVKDSQILLVQAQRHGLRSNLMLAYNEQQRTEEKHQEGLKALSVAKSNAEDEQNTTNIQLDLLQADFDRFKSQCSCAGTSPTSSSDDNDGDEDDSKDDDGDGYDDDDDNVTFDLGDGEDVEKGGEVVLEVPTHGKDQESNSGNHSTAYHPFTTGPVSKDDRIKELENENRRLRVKLDNLEEKHATEIVDRNAQIGRLEEGIADFEDAQDDGDLREELREAKEENWNLQQQVDQGREDWQLSFQVIKDKEEDRDEAQRQLAEFKAKCTCGAAAPPTHPCDSDNGDDNDGTGQGGEHDVDEMAWDAAVSGIG